MRSSGAMVAGASREVHEEHLHLAAVVAVDGPRALSTVKPVRAARPERGLTCPSNRAGIANARPVGTFARPRGAIVNGAESAACRSMPGAPTLW